MAEHGHKYFCWEEYECIGQQADGGSELLALGINSQSAFWLK